MLRIKTTSPNAETIIERVKRIEATFPTQPVAYSFTRDDEPEDLICERLDNAVNVLFLDNQLEKIWFILDQLEEMNDDLKGQYKYIKRLDKRYKLREIWQKHNCQYDERFWQ